MPHREGFLQVLKENFSENLSLCGIEIGCFKGEFARYLLENLPILRLTSIDPLELSDLDIRGCYEDIKENTESFGKRFRLLNLFSDEAIKILDGQYDFVFIDGDHSYEQCRKDILNYSCLIRAGGIIAGHNYHIADNSAHPGVHTSVNEIFGNRVKLAKDFIWYVKKEMEDERKSVERSLVESVT